MVNPYNYVNYDSKKRYGLWVQVYNQSGIYLGI